MGCLIKMFKKRGDIKSIEFIRLERAVKKEYNKTNQKK